MTRALLAAGLLACLAPGVGAWPVLAGARATPAGACYRDHRDAGLWWLAPPLPELAMVGGRPAISLTQYRYSGSRATGDQGTFWGRSVLQFSVRFPGGADRVELARTVLGSRSRVQTLRATELVAEVVFTPVEGDALALGTTRAGDEANPAEGGSVWEERSFALSLSPESTRVVWEAFQRGAVALSLSVVAAAPAFTLPPAAGERDATPPVVPLAVTAVPVTVAPDDAPGLARLLDLDATMSAGYTFLEAACSDFAEGLSFSDLAVVLVQVAAHAVNGDVLTEELRFDPGSPAVQSVRFDRAVRLDQPYRVTVHRIYASGRRDTRGPRDVEVWSGFLDVSSAPPEGRVRLDPRLLY